MPWSHNKSTTRIKWICLDLLLIMWAIVVFLSYFDFILHLSSAILVKLYVFSLLAIMAGSVHLWFCYEGDLEIVRTCSSCQIKISCQFFAKEYRDIIIKHVRILSIYVLCINWKSMVITFYTTARGIPCIFRVIPLFG